MNGPERRTFLLSALATAVFAVVHSLLASLPVKRRVRRWVGERPANGLYRFAFCGVSVVSFAATLAALWPLPDRPLYRATGPARVLMHAGQVAVALALIDANRRNPIERVSGITPAWRFLTGQPLGTPPVAQHPPPSGDAMEGWGGPFRVSSHPNNYGVLLLYWLSPVMTVKWAAMGAVTAVYMVLGSMHEDHRLVHAFGDRYERYRDRVPHLALFPVDRWKRRSALTTR